MELRQATRFRFRAVAFVDFASLPCLNFRFDGRSIAAGAYKNVVSFSFLHLIADTWLFAVFTQIEIFQVVFAANLT